MAMFGQVYNRKVTEPFSFLCFSSQGRTLSVSRGRLRHEVCKLGSRSVMRRPKCQLDAENETALLCKYHLIPRKVESTRVKRDEKKILCNLGKSIHRYIYLGNLGDKQLGRLEYLKYQIMQICTSFFGRRVGTVENNTYIAVTFSTFCEQTSTTPRLKIHFFL